MANPNYPQDSVAPVAHAVAVTPADGSDLATIPTRGIYIGTTGDLKVDLAGGATVTYTGLAAGVQHAISAKRVYATGTTATAILALY